MAFPPPRPVWTGDAVEIVVDDEGPGIPESEPPKVFQPFYRIEDSRSSETGGSGLGLAIAQPIAQAHGGDVFLANRTTGGLRARIRLPAGEERFDGAGNRVDRRRNVRCWAAIELPLVAQGGL